MKILRLFIIAVLLIDMPGRLYAEQAFSFSDKNNIYTEEQRKKLLVLYRYSADNNIYPDIISARLNEASAKSIPFERVYPALRDTVDKLAWINGFFAEEGFRFSKKADASYAGMLLVSLQNGLAFDDVKAIRRSTEKFISRKNFTHLTLYISTMLKHSVPIEDQKQLLGSMHARGYDQHEAMRVIRSLSRIDAVRLTDAFKNTLNQIRDKQPVNAIEHETERFRRGDQKNQNSKGAHYAGSDNERKDNQTDRNEGRHREGRR